MKRQWVGKILSVLLVMIWMLVIFAYSSKSAEASTKQSMRLGKALGKVVIFDWNEWSKEKQEAFAARWDHPVRKAGHVAEYAVLGFLLMIAFHVWGFNGRRAFLLALAAGIIYAASDEFHQTFVPGRAGRISDVCIDSCGVLLGEFFNLILIRLKRLFKKQSS